MERGYEKKEVRMNKYVLTGGPCSGKTSLINCLRKRGFNVLEEVARKVIEEQGGFPTGKKEIEKFQGLMFYEQLKKEVGLNREMVFLDRGIGDYHAYSQHLMGYIPENTKIDFSNRYNKIFVLDRLPFIDDGLRIESGDEEAEKIHQQIIKVYEKFGYSVVNVPVMSIKERANYVLEVMNERI